MNTLSIKGFIGFVDGGQEERGWHYKSKCIWTGKRSVITAEMPTLSSSSLPSCSFLLTRLYSKRTNRCLFRLTPARDAELCLLHLPECFVWLHLWYHSVLVCDHKYMIVNSLSLTVSISWISHLISATPLNQRGINQIILHLVSLCIAKTHSTVAVFWDAVCALLL